MITVNIKGGLGNQMFQYACGRALALRNSDRLRLVRDEDSGDISRPFSLLNFKIEAETASINTVPWLSRFTSKVRQKLTRDFKVAFDPRLIKRKGSIYLDGYFQSEKFFIDQEAAIRRELTLKEPLSGDKLIVSSEITIDPNAVSLHVRRGDYLTHPDFGGIVTPTYYERAISSIQGRIPQARFYVFSDDIAWCRENLPLKSDTVFVSRPELKDYEELHLMSLAQHHIIANSSFSWWGAWLGKNPNKIVMAPTRWANIHEERYRDIIPPTWTRL